MITKLYAQLYSEIFDRIKWNSKPHSPEIKEAARNPKRTISPSLMWAEGGGGSNVSIYFVQECVCNVQYTPRGDCRNYTRVNCVQRGGLMSPRPPPPPPPPLFHNTHTLVCRPVCRVWDVEAQCNSVYFFPTVIGHAEILHWFWNQWCYR